MTIRDLPVSIGDAAQVRKALEVIRDKAIWMKGMYNVPNSLVGNLMEIIAIANTALEAPARNCDVGSVGEQEDRFKGFCESKCDGCKCDHRLFREEDWGECALTWAQMPYKQEAEE